MAQQVDTPYKPTLTYSNITFLLPTLSTLPINVTVAQQVEAIQVTDAVPYNPSHAGMTA